MKKQGSASLVKDGERTPGKVAIFSTCYVNYNEPGMGHDLLAILEHNEVPYEIVEKEACCGMPKLDLGDLDAVARAKEANIPVLAEWVERGWDIVTPVPSCTLMFKQELPLMFPDDPRVILGCRAAEDAAVLRDSSEEAAPPEAGVFSPGDSGAFA